MKSFICITSLPPQFITAGGVGARDWGVVPTDQQRQLRGGENLSRYETLLLELLRRLDEKADRLISLLEVGHNAEHSGHNSTDPSDGR